MYSYCKMKYNLGYLVSYYKQHVVIVQHSMPSFVQPPACSETANDWTWITLIIISGSNTGCVGYKPFLNSRWS